MPVSSLISVYTDLIHIGQDTRAKIKAAAVAVVAITP